MDVSNLEAVLQQMKEQGLLGQLKTEDKDKVELDLMSGYASIQLSFILQQIAPLNEIKSDRVKRADDDKRTVIQEQFQDVNDIEIQRYGTHVEALETPRFIRRSKIEGDPKDNLKYDINLDDSDYNWLLVAMEKKAYYEDDTGVDEGKFIIETDKCEGGFARLRIRQPDETSAFKTQLDDKWYISAEEISKAFDETMKLFYTLEDPPQNKTSEKDPSNPTQEPTEKSEENSTPKGGPSLLIDLDSNEDTTGKETTVQNDTKQSSSDSEGNNENEDKTSTTTLPEPAPWEWKVEKNVLMSFPCSTWPKIASKWAARERPADWPSQESIEKMVAKGCVFVPKSHPNSKHKDIEWQQYIPMEDLLNTLNDTQCQCLVLLRLVHHQCFDMPTILTTTHVTTLLFWVLEKIPATEWTSDNLSKCFNICLDQLLAYVTDGNLPNYFLDEDNLLDGLDTDHLDQLSQQISKVRHEPAEALYTFCDQNLAPYFPISKSYREIFKALATVKGSHEECVKAQHTCLQGLGQLLLADRRWYGAVGVFDRFCELDARLSDRKLTTENFLSQHALQTNLDDGILCYQFLIKHFQRSESLHSHYGNLGCFYHGKYTESTTDEQKEDYMKKANEAFSNALESPSVSTASRTDYANFCLHIEYIGTGIAQTKQVLRTEKDNPPNNWAGNSYGAAESKTVHEELQPWIELRGDINVISLIYSHYLLIRCYLHPKHEEEDKTKKARKVLRQLRTYCNKIKTEEQYANVRQPHYYESSYFLLGYAAKALGKFKTAFQAFSEINEQQKLQSDLSQANMEECMGLMISMDGEEADTEDEEEMATGENENQTTVNGDQLEVGDAGTTDGEPNMEQFRQQQEIELMHIALQKHVKDKKYPEAFTAAEELSAKLNSLAAEDAPQKSAEILLHEYATQAAFVSGAEILEFLVDKLPDSSSVELYYNDLGCMYHAQYADTEPGEAKDALRLKAKQAFEEARKRQQSKNSLDYVTFLYGTEQYSAAIELLEVIIADQMKKTPLQWYQTASFYNKTVSKTVDSNLQSEIEYADVFHVVALIYSYYLLINCCIKLDKNSDAEAILEQMKEACDKLVAEESNPMNYKSSSQSLLGYAAKEICKLEMAQEAFQWAYDNGEGSKGEEKNSLAHENLETCQALLMSMLME